MTNSKDDPKDSKRKRPRATPGQYLKAKDRRILEDIEEGRKRKKKFLKGVTAHEFLAFYENFYKLTYDKEPDWGWQINQFKNDDRLVTVAAEEEPDLIQLIENEFTETITHWCYKTYKIRLEKRAENLSAYDQLKESGQKILKDNSSEFRDWYFRLYRTTHIEIEKEVQENRFVNNFLQNPPLDGNHNEIVDGEQFDFLVERAALKELKDILGNRLKNIDLALKKEEKIWPSDYVWWHNSRHANSVSRRYKYFEQLLVELNKLRLFYPDSKKLSEKYNIKPPEEGKIWALLDHERIATSLRFAGIPTKTYVKYRTAFFKCGILAKAHKIQNGPILIAIGTYNDTANQQQVSRLLKQATAGKIGSFKL